MNDLVSIIIPVFNRFNVLHRTINSVFKQTHKNWELFIIDDCSNEVLNYNLLKLDNDSNEKISIIRNDNNLGPGLSRQRGLEQAKGHFICFLDADDYWNENFIHESLKLHLANPNTSATYSIVLETWKSGNFIRKNSDLSLEYIFPENIMDACPWQTSCIMWKRRYLSHWTDLRTTQDRVFEFNCATINNSIRHVPLVLCYVDKTTGENSADLVKYEVSLIHRYYHTTYFIENVSNIRHPNYNLVELNKILRRNLFKNTLRMLKYSGNDKFIIESLNYFFNGFTFLIAKKFYTLIMDKPKLKLFISRLLLKMFKNGFITV